MRKDFRGRGIKSSFLTNHRRPSLITKSRESLFSDLNQIIIAPSLLFDSRLTTKDFESAVMGWKRVIILLKTHYPDITIKFKPHPRQILSKARTYFLHHQLVEYLDSFLTFDIEAIQLIDEKNLIITDVSGLLNLCDLYNQATISLQDQCLTGGFHFLWLLPEETTESCLFFDTIESLQAFILK